MRLSNHILLTLAISLISFSAGATPPGFPNHGNNHNAGGTHTAYHNYNNYHQQQYNNGHYNHGYHNGYYNNGYYYNGFPTSVVVYPNSVVTTYGPVTPATTVDNYVQTTDDTTQDGINQDTYVVSSADNNTQVWIAAANGQVPNGAVPYTDDNQTVQSNSFYCRGQFNNQIYSGVLTAGDGCYVDDRINAATIRLENYQVLVNR